MIVALWRSNLQLLHTTSLVQEVHCATVHLHDVARLVVLVHQHVRPFVPLASKAVGTANILLAVTENHLRA